MLSIPTAPLLAGSAARTNEIGHNGWLVQGKVNDERRSLAEARALHPHRSAVQFHDLRDDGQTDSQPRQMTACRIGLAVQLENVG